MSAQPTLDLVGGGGLLPELSRSGELGDGDSLPPGPYAVGLTHWIDALNHHHESLPYTVTCADGRAVAGHVPSRAIAEAIAAALKAGGRGA